MEGDHIALYAEMIRSRFTKAGAHQRLPDTAWILGKDGRMPSSNTWKRVASAVFKDDLIKLEFDDGRLQAVSIECRRFPYKTPEALSGSWQSLKTRVSRQLRQPGRGDEAALDGDDRRCVWRQGPVVIEGLSTFEAGRRKLRLTMTIPRLATESPSPSLENLSVY
jgi:hypothetical protein